MTARLLLLALALPSAAFADDWPQWRGPARNGISAERGWRDVWPKEGPKQLWSAEVGIGFSSFAVAGQRVYTLGNTDETDTVYCFDAASGRKLWSHSYSSDLGARFFDGGPLSTPTVDGERVYTIGKWGDLYCFEAASGKIVWTKNVASDAGAPAPAWGFSGSPVILDQLLVLNIGDAGVALEKASGKLVWKSKGAECGYSTPFPTAKGLLLSSAKAYVAVDPKTGGELWRHKWVTEYSVNAADPVLDGDRIFISTGYGKGGALLSLAGAAPETVWETKKLRTQMNPAILIGSHLYGVDGDTAKQTFLKCVDFASGDEKWSRPLAGSGAVAAADGRLLVLNGEGELSVAPASPEGFTPTAIAPILTGRCWTVPVLANGRIYARNAAGRVVCVDVQK